LIANKNIDFTLSHGAVIGGGITGLFCGFIANIPVYEQADHPGGLLASYCLDVNSGVKWYCRNKKDNVAFFEKGGGHWLWGLYGNPYIYKFLTSLSEFKRYVRKSSVYLSDYDQFVPYPLQYHLGSLPKDLRDKALEDIILSRREKSTVDSSKTTFADFLRASFGETLYKIFFEPYNYRYTAGLLYEVAPPRRMKVPDDLDLIIRGHKDGALHATQGYNAYFYYPIIGLGPLVWRLYHRTKCYLKSRVTSIEVGKKQFTVNDSYTIKYNKIYAAIPLIEVLKISDAKELVRKSEPYTSVLVVNVIAKKGHKTPSDHWVYISKSRTGFHRIGYYSNVDKMFLPTKYRNEGYVSAYIEKTFKGGHSEGLNLDNEVFDILDEVMNLGFIGEVIAYDYNFVEIAYTWERPGSTWVDEAIFFLVKNNIIPVGRYGKWGRIEGIVESMEDSLKSCRHAII
jgi:protoporphyrinogen oxidase